MQHGVARPARVSAAKASARPAFLDALAVYLKPRVLVVLLLGFSGGLPFSLTGMALQAWMTESGVDIRTIGLFAAIGIPYVIKFLWAPLTDALDVPILSRLLGRRRGWLMLTQLWLIAAIGALALTSPALSSGLVALAALMVAMASATQDIIIDAFRVESLPEEEQAAGMASYVAAYRVGALVAGAGTLFLVSGFEHAGFAQQGAWTAGFVVMALLVLVGIMATLLADEPEQSQAAEAEHATHARENGIRRVGTAALGAFVDFFSRDRALAVLAFVALFKLADALATSLTTPFVLDLGFSRNALATIVKGVGFAATLTGGFAGGYVARALPLASSLWIGGVLQTITILAFSWQAAVGNDITTLTFAITIQFFTDAVGTVIFVAYLSALCGNPLHTATQYALLTALTAAGRTLFSLGNGYLAHATGWVWYFLICALAATPSFILLAYLQRRGHFATLAGKPG
ncbi:MAG TPA: MFS transporter [Xanthobacteraceae bacterium]|nr:MFS transporter [Xanthobacteraceae bacterium]